MIGLVASRMEQVRALCREFHVRRRELFCAAVGDQFDPETSDLDFLVEFLPLREGHRADAYFGLLEGLQALFGRPVDLVMVRAVQNRYFLEAIEEQREVLYAA